MQAGEAKVMMDIIEIDAVKEIKLKAKGLCEDESGKCCNSAKAFGKSVQLLYVYPYPSEENKGARNYRVKVIVK